MSGEPTIIRWYSFPSPSKKIIDEISVDLTLSDVALSAQRTR